MLRRIKIEKSKCVILSNNKNRKSKCAILNNNKNRKIKCAILSNKKLLYMKQGSKWDNIILLFLPWVSFSKREGVGEFLSFIPAICFNYWQPATAIILSKIVCQGEIFTAVKTVLDLSCVRFIYNKLSWYVKPIWLCEIVSAPKLFHLLIRKIVCWVFHLSIGEREVFPR